MWRGGGGGGVLKPFKIKGCGGNACPPTFILACVQPTVACSLHCLAKANPDGIFLKFNSVRNSLEAYSEFRCKCISKFIRGHPTGPPPPRVLTTEG